MGSHNLNYGLLSAYTSGEGNVTDPGDAGTLTPVNGMFSFCEITTAAAETRTLAPPQTDGQRFRLVMRADGGACVVTCASAINELGATTITFDDPGESILVEAVDIGGTYTWRVAWKDGATLDTDTTTESKILEFPLSSFRTHDALGTGLPATSSNDDFGLVTGTPGSGWPTLQGPDVGGTTATVYAGLMFGLPDDITVGTTPTITVVGGMIGGVAAGSPVSTVDVQLWRVADAADPTAPDTDLCVTAAQSINSLTFAGKTFTLSAIVDDADDFYPGVPLQLRITSVCTDGSNLTTPVTAVVSRVYMTYTRDLS